MSEELYLNPSRDFWFIVLMYKLLWKMIPNLASDSNLFCFIFNIFQTNSNYYAELKRNC